jgi:hypothetical protein
MDKKKLVKVDSDGGLKGFEEFIDGQSSDGNFLPRGNGTKKDVNFEHFTFLTNDSDRLTKVKDLLMDKIPFATKFEQGQKLINEQNTEIKLLRKNIFGICNRPDSGYRRSMGEIFNSFFGPTKKD